METLNFGAIRDCNIPPIEKERHLNGKAQYSWPPH
jgi:hypothetical protein